MQESWVDIYDRIEKKNTALQTEFSNSPEKLRGVKTSYNKISQATSTKLLSVSEVVDIFVGEKTGTMANQSLNELRYGLEIFISFAGETPFSEITAELVRNFKRVVPQLPKSLSHKKYLHSKSLVEIA